jgi:hypothetical protein
LFVLLLYTCDMGTIDEALKKRKKAIQRTEITHRMIDEPEVTRKTSPQSRQQRQNRKEGINVIRKPNQR